MKQYPTIPGGIVRDTPVYVFDKLDGSNVRAEWNPKNGFWKFGRRNALMDDSHPVLAAKTENLIRETYEDALSMIFRAQRWKKAIAFFEFVGPRSFAGFHEVDDEHEVVLIDVSVHPKGFLPPRDFLKLFDGLKHAELLHHGNFTVPLQEQVESGTLAGMTFEGVVAKGPEVSPGRPLMFKRKNVAWFDRLRGVCKDDVEFQRRA